MFFISQKKEKLEEARKQEQRRIQEEKEKKRQEFIEAYDENLVRFYRIFDMVRSLPKKRHIVVVQRENVFKSDSERNCAYLELARKLHYRHQSTGQKWMRAFGKNGDALYAFYEPTKLSIELESVLRKLSEDGHRIQRIRYFSRNL